VLSPGLGGSSSRMIQHFVECGFAYALLEEGAREKLVEQYSR
jgi:hypothetical protein